MRILTVHIDAHPSGATDVDFARGDGVTDEQVREAFQALIQSLTEIAEGDPADAV